MTEREAPQDLKEFVENKCVRFIEERDGGPLMAIRWDYFESKRQPNRMIIWVDGPDVPTMWFCYDRGDTDVRELSHSETEEEMIARARAWQ